MKGFYYYKNTRTGDCKSLIWYMVQAVNYLKSSKYTVLTPIDVTTIVRALVRFSAVHYLFVVKNILLGHIDINHYPIIHETVAARTDLSINCPNIIYIKIK